ncbi:molybdopterin molybdenumtransferase MoeA [Limnohabitans sp. 2KL-1]|uniref:molybdopterin molybdotransferase MoeA n=1 Tax=Limnohabitans sp. 2KL-1 TaxID=1100699 RepID=UPI000D332414|nr:gephyrin-like molybdotransferase Glp [Limnohabitans sp. 2KL-1]PUE47020.1 molybdopterin molybdenumtransferase MoeA [Limnohabitans sp. 2KL-1]
MVTNAPRSPLMSLDDALAALLTRITPLTDSESVATFEADGRILAEDLVSALQVPAFDNSSMDGYAVRCADLLQPGATLRVSQRIAAGHHGQPLAAGQAARIFTGAPVPQGADAIVMQEQAEPVPGETDAVRFGVVPEPGQWIRRSGEDIRQGQTALQRGQKLGPAELGLAASLGLSHLPVLRRPQVALFSTGDELVMPGDVAPADMPPGSIYNSNRFFLRSLLQRLGCEVSDLGIVPDRRDATVAALKTAADHHDLILTSGGVSVGEEDHIKPAVQSLGELALWQIAMKPGKPFAYGQVRRQTVPGVAHFVGLPGNPVSSYLTFLLLVRPLLLKLQAMVPTAPPCLRLPAHFDWPKGDKRREFLRVRRNAQGGLDLFPNQSSGVLTSVVWADGVVDNPAGQTIAPGQMVDFWPFSEWLA